MSANAEGASVKVMRNSGVLALLLSFNMGTSALGAILLAHILTTQELGIYGAAFRAYSWLTASAVFLLPPVLVRFVAELKGAGKIPEAWMLFRRSIVVQSVVVALIAAGLVFWRFVLGNEFFFSRASYLAILAAFVLFAFAQLAESFLRGWQCFREVGGAAVIAGSVRLVGLLALLLTGGNVAAALAVLAASNAATLVVLGIHVSTLRRQNRAPSNQQRTIPHLRKRLVDYAATMGVAGFLSLIVWNSVEVFFLGLFWKDRAQLEEQLAFYTLAIAVAMLPVRLGKTISQALLPAFSELYGSGELERLRRGYHHATVLCTFVGAFICVGGITLAEPLFRLVLPDRLLPAVLPFQLLMVPAMLLSINNAGGAALPALEGHRFFLATAACLAPLNIILDCFLIPNGGANGAAVVNAIVQSLAVGISIWYIASRRGLGFPTRQTAAALLSAVLAWGTGYGVARLLHSRQVHDIGQLLAASTVALVLYYAGVRGLGVLRVEELGVLRRADRLVPTPLRTAYQRAFSMAFGK